MFKLTTLLRLFAWLRNELEASANRDTAKAAYVQVQINELQNHRAALLNDAARATRVAAKLNDFVA